MPYPLNSEPDDKDSPECTPSPPPPPCLARNIRIGAMAPLTATLPRSSNRISSDPRCGTARRYVSSVIWTQPGGQEVSVRDAMLTVLPKMQKRRRILPTMPDTAGPLCRPDGGGWQRARGYGCHTALPGAPGVPGARTGRSLPGLPLPSAFSTSSINLPPPTPLPSPMRRLSMDPSSVSGRGTLAASSCARSAKRTIVAAWCGSGSTKLVTAM